MHTDHIDPPPPNTHTNQHKSFRHLVTRTHLPPTLPLFSEKRKPTHVALPIVISIPTGCYQTGGTEEEEVTQRLHPRSQHLIRALGEGVDSLPQTEPPTAICHTKLQNEKHVTTM